MNLADISKILIAGGLVCTGYFFFLFDTSVPVPTMTIGGNTVGGGRVNNIGLLSQKQNGINLGMGGAILGAILLATSSNKNDAKAEDSNSSGLNPTLLYLGAGVGGTLLIFTLLNLSKSDPSANQANRAKQSEAKTYVSTLTRGQQIFFIEKEKWAKTIEETDLGIKAESENYRYNIQNVDSIKTVDIKNYPGITVQTATAKKEGLKSYLAAAYLSGYSSSDISPISFLCESNEPTTKEAGLPKFDGKALQCPDGYTLETTSASESIAASASPSAKPNETSTTKGSSPASLDKVAGDYKFVDLANADKPMIGKLTIKPDGTFESFLTLKDLGFGYKNIGKITIKNGKVVFKVESVNGEKPPQDRRENYTLSTDGKELQNDDNTAFKWVKQ